MAIVRRSSILNGREWSWFGDQDSLNPQDRSDIHDEWSELFRHAQARTTPVRNLERDRAIRLPEPSVSRDDTSCRRSRPPPNDRTNQGFARLRSRTARVTVAPLTRRPNRLAADPPIVNRLMTGLPTFLVSVAIPIVATTKTSKRNTAVTKNNATIRSRAAAICFSRAWADAVFGVRGPNAARIATAAMTKPSRALAVPVSDE